MTATRAAALARYVERSGLRAAPSPVAAPAE